MMDIDRGRLFVRQNSQGVAVIGVLEMPAELPAEHVYGCSLEAGRIRLNPSGGEPGVKRAGYMSQDEFRECDANGVLLSLKFLSATSDTGDAQELFVRQSALPSSTPGMSWCWVIGARPRPFASMSSGGLYEVSAGSGFKRVSVEPGFDRGLTLGQLLREPLWGPSGAYGLAHSLEPGRYPEWVVRNRELNANRDPSFREFLRRMEQYGPAPLYYTRARREEDEAVAAAVAREMACDEDGTEEPRGGVCIRPDENRPEC